MLQKYYSKSGEIIMNPKLNNIKNVEERLDRCLDRGHQLAMKRFRQRMLRKGIVIK